VMDRFLYVHEPLAINGASRHSTGTSQFAVRESADASPARLFESEGNIAWHPDVPRCADGSYPPSFQAMVYESYLQSRALRNGAGGDRHAEQLELILASAGPRETAIGEWGRRFAAAHQLNFDVIGAKARRRKLWSSGTAAWRRAAQVISTWSVGSPNLPIENVYEASLVAARVRSAVPSRFENLRRLAGRAVQRLRRS